jgi:carbamate kinase
MARIVIALGGNALGNTPEEQLRRIDEAAPSLIGLIKQGHEIIVSHGNGPQVGMIKLGLDTAADANAKVARFPLPECTAMSQGYIGYHLQNGILRQLRLEKMPWHVATVVTQMEVDPADPAFRNPTKPIGAFYTEDEAKRLMAENPGMFFKEDAGRGWRQMVPSPKPVDIVEKDSILNLLDHEFIVIACGGGGIPVVKDADGDYEGVAAVIDKDFASAKLAELCQADYLFILTAVDRVCIHYGKPDQQELKKLTTAQARELAEQGQFAPGSMLPKVEAAIRFAESARGRKAVIASLEKAPLAMQGESGTVITME